MTAELQLLAADEFETAARTDLPLCFRSILVIVSAERSSMLCCSSLICSGVSVYSSSQPNFPVCQKDTMKAVEDAKNDGVVTVSHNLTEP